MLKIGDEIKLSGGAFPIVACFECGKPMVNLHPFQIYEGDLMTLKSNGVSIGNPGTVEQICCSCDYAKRPRFSERVHHYYQAPDVPSDSGFFGGGYSSPVPSYSPPDTGGGFGGFGGGSFGGGGASGGF